VIDVSNWQGRVNWRQVKASGVDRAYIKWGEGATVDAQAVRNVTQARANGVQLGLYFYAHPSRSPLDSARWFIRTAAPYLKPGDLPPALDLEISEGLSWQQLNEWKQAWFAQVDAHIGCRAVFYSYLSFWQHMTLFPDRPVWGADLRAGFKPPSTWAIWQYSFTGSVPGISGHVDLSRVMWQPKPIAA